jgi:hypothetical protein
VSFQAAEDLLACESFAGASGCVGAGFWVVDHSVVRDRPEGVVALAVAAAVEPVAAVLPLEASTGDAPQRAARARRVRKLGRLDSAGVGRDGAVLGDQRGTGAVVTDGRVGEVGEVCRRATSSIGRMYSPRLRRVRRSPGFRTSMSDRLRPPASSMKYRLESTLSVIERPPSRSSARPSGEPNPTARVHAAASYSWISPPKRSRRRTPSGSLAGGIGVERAGGTSPRAR